MCIYLRSSRKRIRRLTSSRQKIFGGCRSKKNSCKNKSTMKLNSKGSNSNRFVPQEYKDWTRKDKLIFIVLTLLSFVFFIKNRCVFLQKNILIYRFFNFFKILSYFRTLNFSAKTLV